MSAEPPNQSPPSPTSIPTFPAIRTCTHDVFHVRPCLWQMKVVDAILRGNDVLCIAGTGMGKTLMFWMPLLFRPDGIQIVITPLNLLGKQNVAALERAHIPAISISAETATPANFHVSTLKASRKLIQDNLTFKLGHPHS
ncbi:hypothetical protein JVT61DRAFT_11253 [Boletus reticuloceps]|uniref:DEAD/DEAH-box helicase domain-containing protein n=1 Tax=Boletus reticuloceps TaxID=495285 RepID=A0A8I2YEX9_9AGAM|nr:hypothetical protein JVT61DRAFT_11253 [Boletus reticuloceps]